MAIAIVAIPSQDDYVWEISSEKVPHLTLLILGDQLENVSVVNDFVGHIAATSLSKFTLSVDRRGVLGDESADVLFFDGRVVQTLENVRSYLLGNTDIFKAYSAIKQFDSWTPHLTLGYPETPAKSDKNAIPYSVTFDRIALWTGNYEGVEFSLENNNDELSMIAKGEAFFQHFGVKGMKWGVRRDESSGPEAVVAKTTPGRRVKTSGGKRQEASEDAIRVAAYRQKAKKSTIDSLSNKELQDLISRMNLEQQYIRLHGGNAIEKGTKFVKSLIGLGRTGQEAFNVTNSLLNDIKKK